MGQACALINTELAQALRREDSIEKTEDSYNGLLPELDPDEFTLGRKRWPTR
jgi:hypothetical protein